MMLKTKKNSSQSPLKVRLQKVIAQAGIASRRKAEDLILEGAVTVNGKIVSKMGISVDPLKDHVKVNNKLITRFEPLNYVLLNKPKGYISTCNDPEGRLTVLSLIKNDVKGKLKPAGRLDFDTEGLIIMTNDGELINQISHPKFKVEKVYMAKVKGVPERRAVEKLKNGIIIDRKKTLPAKVKVISKKEKNSWVQITVTEGRKHQVKKMFEFVGHPVLKLKRTKYAFLNDKALPSGKYRVLTKEEILKLKGIMSGEV